MYFPLREATGVTNLQISIYIHCVHGITKELTHLPIESTCNIMDVMHKSK